MKYRSRRREILFVSLCIAASPGGLCRILGWRPGARCRPGARRRPAAPPVEPNRRHERRQVRLERQPGQQLGFGVQGRGRCNTKIAEIPVEKEPWCVAITPDDEKVYVTNMASGTVSVIDASRGSIDTIKVGTEPFGCALTPDGSSSTSPTSRRGPCR